MNSSTRNDLLQIVEQPRLEVRRLLVRGLVDVRAQIEQAWSLLSIYPWCESIDFTEVVETDTGRAKGDRVRRVEEDITAPRPAVTGRSRYAPRWGVLSWRPCGSGVRRRWDP